MLKYRWKLKEALDEGIVSRLRSELNDLPAELAMMLARRGVNTFDDARYFFRARLDELHDPFEMKDMDLAVLRIRRALDGGERIVVYGDYDVDGTCSTAILTGFLLSLGAKTEFFIPNRFEHGYGLSEKGIEHAAAAGADLIVALDCGVSSLEEADAVRARGIDLIICDHHTPHDTLPNAVAVLDPKRNDCPYPFKDLCGCGVTFKLVQALLTSLGRDPMEAAGFLDLVALATASDIVSVTGENRILLREGIRRIRTNPRTGIKCLAEEAHTRLSDCTVSTILFGLGPRINAAGRLGDAGRAVALLLTDDAIEAVARARQLERLNQERRAIDKETLEQAERMAEKQLLGSDRHTVVLHDPDWHMGVIGIVASRLVDRFYRPAVLLTTANGVARGSARSINGVNVFEAIRSCEHLLIEFGGHDYAAGLTLPIENVQAFADGFEKNVATQVRPEHLDPVLDIEAELALSTIDGRFWAVLKQFEPFGPDNDCPVFLTSNLQVADGPRTVGKDGAHVKFVVRDTLSAGTNRDVIGFRMGTYTEILEQSRKTGRPIQLVYSVDENTWNGRRALQLQAKDLRLQEEDSS